MGLTDEQIERIKLVSEEVTTVMGATPRWIVRYGNVIILVCALLILAMAWFIQYPDTVQGKVSFKESKSMAVIKPQQDGSIKNFLVKDGQPVKKGDPLFTFTIQAGDSAGKETPFIATTDGKIRLLNSLTGDHPYIVKNEAVLAIIPDYEKDLKKVTVNIPYGALGKVDLGQRVLINMDNYPVQEYGMLTGTVEAISPIPVNGLCEVTVRLNGLSTTYDKKIDITLASYSGNARIITKNRSILQRVFSAF